MVETSPLLDSPGRFDARKLVLVPPPLVCAKDEMSMVIFFKATIHEVEALCSSAA